MQMNLTEQTNPLLKKLPEMLAKASCNNNFSDLFNKQMNVASNMDKSSDKANLVLLGTITPNKSTVSDLLIENPKYGKECWDIIFSSQNFNKPYKKIPVDTKVYLNSETKEIVWDYGKNISNEKEELLPEVRNTNIAYNKSETEYLSKNLVDAVKPLIGKSYEEVDCYELVVNALKNMGVKYRGQGSLSERLTKMAIEKGLPLNAFFNGEGLIKASGSDVYYKSIPKVSSIKSQSGNVIKEITPLLEEGQILSFSTPHRGHTGIISKKDDLWTFINSGNMDHNISSNNRKKGVGEEILHDEIVNWFKLAAKNNESLEITVGKFNQEKLAMFNKTKQLFSKNV